MRLTSERFALIPNPGGAQCRREFIAASCDRFALIPKTGGAQYAGFGGTIDNRLCLDSKSGGGTIAVRTSFAASSLLCLDSKTGGGTMRVASGESTGGFALIPKPGGAQSDNRCCAPLPMLCLDSKTGGGKFWRSHTPETALCLDSKTGGGKSERLRHDSSPGFALIPKPGGAKCRA